MKTRVYKLLSVASVSLILSASTVAAGPLLDRIKEGKPIRFGFSISQPASFVGKDGKPDGMVNVFVVGVLRKMGYTNVEAVQMDWGSLTPALQADRIDIITSGMYITKTRCANIEFADPAYVVPDVLVVLKGNPKGLENYADIAKKGATLVEIAGYAPIETAKRVGVPSEKIMIVPGHTEVLAAIRSGRADAFAVSLSEGNGLVKSSNGSIEVTDPSKMQDNSKNFVSIGFRKSDADFVKQFDVAQRSYLGSPEMMETVAPFGYTQTMLPNGQTAAWVCER
ncbi:transporter substrate-binding domain-containing protein [Bradyrhizobium sp. 30]|uniref:transporter substrate-binding domain-containing protein n=1 Tax=Bradyrhizobium sp. 30 TaxID=2782669 RepID=UPI001FF9983F|nr:transporter substrate-binding domain-containing protein [Bradyrhizobium sp. 30]MCK1292034.1 transporter substrate-binding domain-containing protein [Bradyrhizobium sp. 30]